MHVNGKQVKSSFKVNNQFFTNHALQLLYMNLFGPMRVSSLGGKILHLLYSMIILDLNGFYFFFTRMKQFKFCKRVQNEKDCFISKIKSDHGREFDNLAFKN
jgi:hypothetical protein